MKRTRVAVVVLATTLCVLVAAAGRLSGTANVPRPIALEDIVAWKSVSVAEVSPDGRWLGYRLSPLDGDSEVVIRETAGTKEYRVAVGDTSDSGGAAGGPGPAQSAGQAIQFSTDSRWATVTVMPSKTEGARLRKQKKPIESSATLINLASGDRTEVPRVKRAGFSGETGMWIAMHRYPADAAAGGPPPAGPGGGSAGPGKDKPKGSDLILRELATESVLDIGNVSDFAFDRSGRWLALTIDTGDKVGNGLQLRDMQTGAVVAPPCMVPIKTYPTVVENGTVFIEVD
jgi:hypothetical protein